VQSGGRVNIILTWNEKLINVLLKEPCSIVVVHWL